jgi:hypothetical protein
LSVNDDKGGETIAPTWIRKVWKMQGHSWDKTGDYIKFVFIKPIDR